MSRHLALRPGARQGILLSLLSMVSVAAALLLAPIIPKIVSDFAADPAAHEKAILALTVPALLVVPSSIIWGRLIDRLGRKRLLIAGLCFYGIFGIWPAFVSSLEHIIVLRILLGIAEAAVMASSTTLIGDYFEGRAREKWIVVQTGAASVSGILFLALGGALGETDWRNAFFVYALAFVAIPFCIFTLREPTASEISRGEKTPAEFSGRFPWRNVGTLYVIGFVASIYFFVLPIQIPFLLTETGTTSTLAIGLTNAIGAIAVPVGSIIFKWRSSQPFKANLGLAFMLVAIGFGISAFAQHYWMLLSGVVVGSLGAGIVLPLVLSTIMNQLPFDLRGRGTGGWQAAFFLGNFVSPLAVLALQFLTGSLALAIGTLALFGLTLSVGAFLSWLVNPALQFPGAQAIENMDEK